MVAACSSAFARTSLAWQRGCATATDSGAGTPPAYSAPARPLTPLQSSSSLEDHAQIVDPHVGDLLAPGAVTTVATERDDLLHGSRLSRGAPDPNLASGQRLERGAQGRATTHPAGADHRDRMARSPGRLHQVTLDRATPLHQRG